MKMTMLSIYRDLLESFQFDKLKKAKSLVLPIEGASRDVIAQLCQPISLHASTAKIPEKGDVVLTLELVPIGTRHSYLLMAIPVKLDIPDENKQTFRLYPRNEKTPLVNPEYLLGEHSERKSLFSMGHQEIFFAVLQEATDPNSDALWDWLTYAFHLIETTSGVPLDSLAEHIGKCINQKLSLRFGLRRVPDNAGIAHVRALYHGLLSDGPEAWKSTALNRAVCSFSPEHRQSSSLARDNFTSYMQNSAYMLGHMDAQERDETGDLNDRSLFPLDNTQRQVLVCSDLISRQEETGHLLAVNGPPGSGKTAMLKAVIAHLWVKAALNDEDCPLIVAVGATNISVKNVIQAFPAVAHRGAKEGLCLYRRWLPSCPTYGTFFPSAEAERDLSDKERRETMLGTLSDRKFPTVFNWKGESQVLSDVHCLDQLQVYYLEKANHYFYMQGEPSSSSISDVVARLGDLLKARYELMEVLGTKIENALRFSDIGVIRDLSENVDAVKQFKRLNQTLESFMMGDRVSVYEAVCRERIRDEKIPIGEYDKQLFEDAVILLKERWLDLRCRSELFHIAARYWEGRYLIDSQKELLFARTRENIIKALRRMCMLTPCIVSTFHILPKLFKVLSFPAHTKIEQYAYGAIDWLITDETGMADTRLGLPAMGLAKHVIAVGDVLQLSPVVTDLTQPEEFSGYLRYGINRSEYSRIYLEGLTACNGSLLHLIRLGSSLSYQGPGLMLRGHYRCQQDIIQYCNEMVYENKLFYEPFLEMRDGVMPPMSWVASTSKCVPGQTGSRINTEEALLIAEYIVEKWPAIALHYQSKSAGELPSIGDVLAIVTPFNAQPDVITAALEKAITQNPSSKLTLQDIGRITIGTIHSLQGAEKDIVFFSGVQTAADGDMPFFANQQYLLNVAVSRAKKSFVAFICPELYRIDCQYTQEEAKALIQNSICYLGYYLAKKAKPLFPSKLLVVEAHGKVNTLKKILGKDYEVIATEGSVHSLGVSDDALSQTDLAPRYKITEEGEHILETLLRVATKMDDIFLAMDDDYVGEAISWHLYHHIIKRSPGLEQKLKRIRLRAITSTAVNEALTQIDEIDERRVSAEVTREVCDVLMARYLTPLMRSKYRLSEDEKNLFAAAGKIGLISRRSPVKTAPHQSGLLPAVKKKPGMGRVKSAVLNLLLNNVIQETNPQRYVIGVTLRVNGKTLRGTVKDTSGAIYSKLSEKGTFLGKPQNWRFMSFEDTSVEVPPPGMSTVEVLQYAWKDLKMKPDDVMRALQYLYMGDF